MIDQLQDKPIISGTFSDSDVEPEETQDSPAEDTADLAPATDEDQAEPEQTPGADTEDGKEPLSEGVQKAINKKHYQMKEAERRAEQIAADKAKLEARVRELEAASGEIVIPDIPDPYDYVSDEEYTKAILARENVIVQKARADAAKEAAEARQLEAQKEQEAKEQAVRRELVEKYARRASSLGVDVDALAESERIVNMYNIRDEVAEFIMKDESGPLIVQYLANNPATLEEIAGMNSLDAALRLHTDIKPIASKLLKQSSAAPPPPDNLDGSGAPEQISSLIAGGKFE